MTGEPVKIRILLADGHSLFRQAVRKVFESETDVAVVGEAQDGQQAVVEAVRTRPDVVLLHAGSADGEVVRTTQLMRQRVPGCRVIVLVGEEDQATLVDVVEAGASGYLTMDCALTELIAAARAVSRGETLVPSRMLSQLVAELINRRRDQHQAFERLSRLTPREREVLELLGSGANNKTIARVLMISPETARTHVQNLVSKLGVHSRLEAAAFVLQARAVTPLGGEPAVASRLHGRSA